MKIIKAHPVVTVLTLAVLVAAAVLFLAPLTQGAVDPRVPNVQPGYYLSKTLLNATTTTATSTNITGGGGYMQINGAKKVTFYFSRGDTNGTGNTGNTNFRLQVTRDGDTWEYFNKLVQNLATSTDPTSLSSVTISAATSTVVASMDLQYDTFYAVRCIAVETTDGQHTCKANAEF